MSNPFNLIETAELVFEQGLPYSLRYNDVYFSRKDGFEEKKHVFILGNNLLQRWQHLCDEAHFTIGEMGFGTGLNFLITWWYWQKYAPKNAKLHYLSCENYPLRKNDLIQCLALWPQLSSLAEQFIAQYPILTPGFHHLSFVQGQITLTLMLGEASRSWNQCLLSGDSHVEPLIRHRFVDAWYLDGFSPAKNEQMWSQDIFETMALLSQSGTSAATFSAAAQVKNGLQAAGFDTRIVKGYGPKRHMLVAAFRQAKRNKKHRQTPWYTSLARPYEKKTALIIGGGLAGCSMANNLARRGWQVTLLERSNEVGQGASGNEQAVLYPKLSAFRSPLTEFMLTAFLYAQRFYSALIPETIDGELNGILQLAFNNKEAAAQENMKSWLAFYPELGKLVTKEQASELAGLLVNTGGLFIANAGWINSKQLCAYLIEHPAIQCIRNIHIEKLDWADGQWHLKEYQGETLILCNGYLANQFAQTAYLPLKVIRGQITRMQSNERSRQLKIPVCGEGHLLPAYHDFHSLGATYHLGLAEQSYWQKDDVDNIKKSQVCLEQQLFDVKNNFDEMNWVGVRGATPDYLPLVGGLAEEKIFWDTYQSLAANAKQWVNLPATHYSGLYSCVGFGSRGLTTIPLVTEWLASQINGEFSFLPNAMVQSISPTRFLRRQLIRT